MALGYRTDRFYACALLHISQLAKKYHPDSNKDESAKPKFVEIQEAYDVGAYLVGSLRSIAQ